MNWNQFKQHIDMILEERGISKESEIWYIDISFPNANKIGEEDGRLNTPHVEVEENLGINIH